MQFPPDYPERPPIVSFLSDVFHPLVTPLTTYTYSARDTGSETVSSADEDRLPPGGLNLRHDFPEWFDRRSHGVSNKGPNVARAASGSGSKSSPQPIGSAVLTVEVLQYLRVVFDTEAILDTVPVEAAANTGAWHAWTSYRLKSSAGRISSNVTISGVANGSTRERSSSPRQQPGGARKPGEWNWQGVWEDRVRKSIQTSISEHMLYSNEDDDVICFSKNDPPDIENMIPARTASIT